MQTYLEQERGITLVGEVDAPDISAWFAQMRISPGGHGKPRSERTIQTYARSARAFFHWLMHREIIQSNPFDRVVFPKVGKPLIQTIDAEEFERLLLACTPSNESGPIADRAAARNRAILWVLYDTGIRISELCGLRLSDFDRKRGILTVKGKGSLEAIEPRQVVRQFDRLGLHHVSEVVDAQRQEWLGVTRDRHVGSRHALEKTAHIHGPVADDWKVAQRIESEWTVPIPYIAKTRNAGKLFDTIHAQSARTARGMVAGTTEGEGVIMLSPGSVDGIDHMGRVFYLNSERVVTRLLTWLVAKNLQRNSEQRHC